LLRRAIALSKRANLGRKDQKLRAPGAAAAFDRTAKYSDDAHAQRFNTGFSREIFALVASVMRSARHLHSSK
jgi:hypothetical protein